MDGGPKLGLRASTGPTTGRKGGRTDEAVKKIIPHLSVKPSAQQQHLPESRSGLDSYFSPVGWDQNPAAAAFGAAENDGSSSSILSVSSAATESHSPRGPTSSRSSDVNHLEDLSDPLNATGGGRASSVAPTESAATTISSVGADGVVAASRDDDLDDDKKKSNRELSTNDRAHSEVIDCQPRELSPSVTSLSSYSHRNASQLLSEWNESPFVSSYPNYHGQTVEVSSDRWNSQEFPWHIELQDVATGDMVASGSYGMVFKGIYKDEKVAVKVLLIPEASSKRELEKLQLNFRKEIDLWYKLSHPNIVQFHGAYIGEPRWAIITEFLHGGSLRSYLSRQQRKRLPIPVVHSMALDIARGMDYLHENGIMHRDLKSANLLLDENGGIKVADLGCARLEIEDGGNLTAETGTIRWMAPEVICHSSYSRKIDVYSFGIVLWELTTSQLPFEGMSFVQLAHAVANDHHRPNTSDLPSYLAKLMRQCWDKDDAKRPDFATVVKYLEANGAEGCKSSFKFIEPESNSKAEKADGGDAYGRQTVSMRGGQALRGYRNPKATLAPRTYQDALSDDEDWVTIRKQCRCSVM